MKRRRAVWSFAAAIFVWFFLLPTSEVVAPIAAVVIAVALNLYIARRDARRLQEERSRHDDVHEVRRP